MRKGNKSRIFETPTPEVLRECIKQGYCWWCGKGGWQRLARHTVKHGIYAKDIREMAIILKQAPTCIKEESEIISDRRLHLLKEGKVKIPDWRLGVGLKHEYSEAGKISQRKHAEKMRTHITPEDLKRGGLKLRKPHPCPICGKIIPDARHKYCSRECVGKILGFVRFKKGEHRSPETEFKKGQSYYFAEGLKMGRGLWDTAEHRQKMIKVLDKAREKSKPHNCPTCGKFIPKSRPKYCSPKCSSQKLKLSFEEIKASYLNGVSSVKLAKRYGCCDHTIRRLLVKSGVEIRNNKGRIK